MNASVATIVQQWDKVKQFQSNQSSRWLLPFGADWTTGTDKGDKAGGKKTSLQEGAVVGTVPPKDSYRAMPCRTLSSKTSVSLRVRTNRCPRSCTTDGTGTRAPASLQAMGCSFVPSALTPYIRPRMLTASCGSG